MTLNRAYVVTGATSGLGLELARALLARPDTEVIAGARAPDAAGRLKALPSRGTLTLLPLDLIDQQSVHDFAEAVQTQLNGRRIDAVFCIAGIQNVGRQRFTPDGVDETFAANHLGHFTLVNLLLGHMKPGGRVVTTASGTHNPAEPTASRLGFRGAVFTDADAVARGDMPGATDPAGASRDRYATSKLCCIYFARALADLYPPEQIKSLAFDPGLMAGTGLAREHPALLRFVWVRLGPVLSHLIPHSSSPARSAKMLFSLAADAGGDWTSGDYLEFTGKHAPRSEESSDKSKMQDLMTVSARLTGRAFAQAA